MNNLTYKDFLESEILNFNISWEQRRKYIKELMDIEDKNMARSPNCIQFREDKD